MSTSGKELTCSGTTAFERKPLLGRCRVSLSEIAPLGPSQALGEVSESESDGMLQVDAALQRQSCSRRFTAAFDTVAARGSGCRWLRLRELQGAAQLTQTPGKPEPAIGPDTCIRMLPAACHPCVTHAPIQRPFQNAMHMSARAFGGKGMPHKHERAATPGWTPDSRRLSQEIGPYNDDWSPRKHAWTQSANLLFVDNPVGTGYSYVDDLQLLGMTSPQCILACQYCQPLN